MLIRSPRAEAPSRGNALERKEIAELVALDLPVGAVVNLGIGLPTKVADFIPPNRGIVLHTENGMLGMGPLARGDDVDPDLINAGKVPVTELPGAAYFDHAESFSMIRGGHIDVCVMGRSKFPSAATSPIGALAHRTRCPPSAVRWTWRQAPSPST